MQSHPLWVRGLKHPLVIHPLILTDVASFMGAWIETVNDRKKLLRLRSHPLWVRGLKL